METKTTRKRLHARIIAWMMIFAMGMTLLSPCTLSPPVSAAASFVELQPESDSLQFDMKKGDTFYFGNNKKAGGAPIEWRIIGFEGNIATVMSERVLENMSYNTSADNGSWKDSSVCNYLNNEFYNNTFSASEHSMIQPYYGMRDWIQESEGERYAIDIHQKIVLPSLDEIRAGGEWQWTGRDNERVARDIRGFSVFYWLRTTVRMGGNVNARIVNTIGNVGNERGMDVTQAFGLRPVMRVDLSPAVLAEKTTDGAFKLTLPVSSGLAQIPDLKNYAGNITYTSSSQYKANFDAPATVYVTGTTTGADLSVNYKIVNAGQKLAGTGLPIPQGFVQSIQQTLNIAPKQLDGLTDLPQGLYTVSVWLQRNNVDTTKACHEASTPRTFQLDLRNPYVVSVTPNSTGSPTSGSLSITFDREMFSGTGTGTVSIGTTVLPATSRTWNGDNTVVTYPYSGLAANQKYTVNISGFRSFNSTGPQMNADNTHTFSTWPNQHSTVGTAAYTLKVGDRIYLGKDKSDTSAVSDGHPIMWRVVKMDGGIATLLSEYAIGHKSAWYSGLPIASQSANWQDSEAYKYLNNTFYNDSFSAVEKAAIMTSYTTAATTEESDFGSGDNFTIINAGRIGLPAWQNEVNAWFTGTNGRTTTRTSRSTGVNYWFRTRFQLLPVAPFFYNNNTGSFDIGWGSSGNPSFADSLNLRPMLRFDTSKMSYLSKVTSAPEPRYTNMDGTIYHTSTVGANVGGTMGSYYRAMFPGDSGISNVRDSNGRAITGSYPAPVIYGTGGNGMIQINLSSVPAGSQIVYTIRNGTAVLVNEIALKEGGGNWTNGNNGLVLSNLRFDGEFLPKGNYKLDLLLQNPNSNAAVTLNDIDLRVGDPVNDTYFAALKPPVKGANAMTSFSNSQYDATVAWKKGDGTVHTGAFAANTEYVATVTLTPKTGYVMRSVPSNAFDAPGCSTQPTNAVSNGTVTVNYPATADVAVNDKIYFGRNMASTNAPIQWRVVAVDNLARTISVLSENVLELRRFDPTGHKLWYDSEVCDYLNDQGEFSNRGFLSKNFTTSERSAIKPVYGSQFEENGIYTINASSRVVLPSWNELNNAGAWDAAFTSNASRQAVIDGTTMGAGYWLRTPVSQSTATNIVCVIGTEGNVITTAGTNNVDLTTRGIRPVMKLDLSLAAPIICTGISAGAAVNGTTGSIVATFNKPVSSLLGFQDVHITDGTGSAMKHSVSYSGNTMIININSVTAGTVNVDFTGTGQTLVIAQAGRTVTLTRGSSNQAISLAQIGGIKPPVKGQIPVTSITGNSEYAGTVTWSGNPSNFEAGIEYTATITLTPTGAYSLSSVPRNFFQVPGAATTNNAGSGIVTAKFPATLDVELGDAVHFGMFDNNPIKWSIVEVDAFHETVTLFSDNALGMNRHFQLNNLPTPWGESDACNWLNGTFLTTSFTTEERAKILPYSNLPETAGLFTIVPNQKVVLPSIAEVQNGGTWGFSANSHRNKSFAYWLRSNFNSTRQDQVQSDGNIYNATFTSGLRYFPVIKMKASDLPTGVSISMTTDYDFGTAIEGYPAQTPLTVHVINHNNTAVTNVSAGSFSSDFTFSTLPGTLAAKTATSFTAVPKTGLLPTGGEFGDGEYEGDVMLRYNPGTGNVIVEFNVTFKVVPSVVNGISINRHSLHTFTDTDPLSVTILNTGSAAVTNAKATITGANADSFEISAITGTLNTQNSTADFTVNPKTALPVGTYTASVVVTADNGLFESFPIRYVVQGTPDFTLSQTSAHTFLGDNDSDTLSVMVTGTGTASVTNLKAQLIGTGASNFILDAGDFEPTLSGAVQFTVKPQTSLTPGVYTATVVVTADGGLSRSFVISYTVDEPYTPPIVIDFELSSEHYDFSDAYDFDDTTPLTVKVSNTGNTLLSGLKTELADDTYFTIGAHAAIIAEGASLDFTVTPKLITEPGLYSTVVVVTADGGLMEMFTVRLVIGTPPAVQPHWNVDNADDVSFDDTTPHEVEIFTSTGLTNLKAAIVGTDADSFEFDPGTFSVDELAASGTESFTVAPKENLAAGKYTAAVIITADGGLVKSFTLNYIVFPTATNIISVTISASQLHAGAAEVFLAAYAQDGSMIKVLSSQDLLVGENTYNFDISGIDGVYEWKAFVWTNDGQFTPVTSAFDVA